VFTTEGHILTLGKEWLKPMSSSLRKMRRMENNQCPAYIPLYFGPENLPGLTVGVGSRSEMDYSRQLVGSPVLDTDKRTWHTSGWCEAPEVDLYVSSLNLYNFWN